MAILDLDDDNEKGSAPVATKKVPVAEPDFLMPGSKSDAAIRSFGNAASFGLAPKLSALLSPGKYGDNLKQYLDANKAAQIAQPGVSLASSLAGSVLPAIATGGGSIPAQIAKNAVASGVETFGNTERTGMDAAKDVAQGALIGGATAGALPMLGKVVKGASDFVRGTPDVEKIGEAAIKFKNASIPPIAAQTKPGSAKAAWNELNSPRSVPSAALDDVIRHNPMNVDKATLEAVIKNANATRPNPLKEIIPTMMQHSAYGAGAGFVGTGGDMDAALKGGVAGLVSGAGTGASRAMSGSGAKLRMPSNPLMSGEIPGLGAVNSMVSQTAARDVKERSGTSTSPFGSLTSYLKQAEGSTNPAVQQVAEQAEGIAESNDPDAKRKAAMVLQDTPEGRAVGNSSSNVRDLD